MFEINFYDLNSIDKSLYTRVVAVCRYNGKWVYVRQKGKTSWEIPGGHIEEGETWQEAIKRELYEETGISGDDIVLTHIMNFQYIMQDMELEVYVGKLNKDLKLIEELNKLYWIDKNENFFDLEKYAGEGNIGHMLQQVEIYKNKIF